MSSPEIYIKGQQEEVLAIQFLDLEQAPQIVTWGTSLGGSLSLSEDEDPPVLFIHHDEGNLRARVNDWVVQGSDGVFYPVTPKVFEGSYMLRTEENFAKPVTQREN